MNLAKQTELRLFTEFKNNQEAIHRNAELIEAHEQYAETIGKYAVCSVCYGNVNVWIQGANVVGLRLSNPLRIICNKPVFEVDWNGFVISVVEE